MRACLIEKNSAYYRPKYFAPQIDWLCDSDGKLLVDFVGKVENLDEDFTYICRKIGIDRRLEHRNKSERGDYRDYYDDETRQIVADVFARSIEAFGYKF